MTGYITKGIGGFYYVKTSEGIVECKPRGIFRKQKITPVAGDVVTLETENGGAVIADIAPRRNIFVRPPMANLDVLLYISKHGGSAVLCTEDTKVFVVRCGRIVLTELKGATVSVFPFDGSSCNLTYEGLQYPLEKKDLTAGSSLMGVSNCIISDRAEIRVNIGCALVIVYTPKDMPAEPPQSEIQNRLPETEDKKDTEK